MRKSKLKISIVVSVITIFLVLITAKVAFVQDMKRFDRPPGQNGLTGEVNIKEIGGVLSLTDEQKMQLQEIMKDHRKESRLELFEKLAPILDAEQTKILQGIKSDLENDKMPRSVVENRVTRLETKLDLNSKQKEQLIKTFSEFGDKIMSLREKNTGRDELREEMKIQFDALHNELETILSPEQMEKMQKMNKDRRRNFGRKMGYRDRQEMYQNVLDQLDLSPDQEAKIEAIKQESRSSFQQAMQSINDREERQIAMKEHKDKVAAQIEEVLTDDQKAKFEEMRNGHDNRRRGQGRRWQ
jgi:Spy/CpxP family protein refolding chaperone